MKINLFYSLNEFVYDYLSKQHVKIIGIQYNVGKTSYSQKMSSMGNIGYWVDHPYLDGSRFPWEIDKINSEERWGSEDKFNKQNAVENYLLWW